MRIAAIAALIATGCGDNLATIALDDFVDARRGAECAHLVRCGLFADADACAAYFPSDEDATNQLALRAAIAAGKIRYDGAHAQICIDAFAERGCDVTARDAREVPSACTRTFTGQIADGAECAFDGECASNACDVPLCPPTMCCPGQCLPTIVDAAIGDICSQDTQCTTGAYCAVDGTCHALGLVREPCTREAECDFDLACIGATELMPGACRDLPAIGETCPYMRCADENAVCANGTCVAVGLPGDPCTNASACSPYGECDLATQHCIDLPMLGMPCTIGCAGDAWCNAGACAALLPDDEPCTAGNQCASTYCAEGPIFDYCTTPPVCS